MLWLTDLYGLDIRCVRLSPYRVGDRLLLDVQQVIPLPEASELTIQLQRRATQERAVRATDGRDWTQYVIAARRRERAAPQAAGRSDHGHDAATAGVPAREIAKCHFAFAVSVRRRHFQRAELREAFLRRLPEGRRAPLVPRQPRSMARDARGS